MLDRRAFLEMGLTTAAASLWAGPGYAKMKKETSPLPSRDLNKEDAAALKAQAAEIFTTNQVRTRYGIFHMPSPNTYNAMFAWDSGWHAIGLCHIDPNLAASEIDVVLARPLPDGRIAHEVKFSEVKEKPNVMRSIVLYALRKQYDDQGRSAFVDPPSFFIAAEKVYHITQDKEWLKKALPGMTAFAHYLTAARDLFHDGLVSIINPWESGTDASAQYDEPLHIKKQTPVTPIQSAYLYVELLNAGAALDWDIERIAQANRFVMEDLTMNSIVIRGLRSLGRLHAELGDAEKGRALEDQAAKMTETLIKTAWDENAGCFFPRWDLKNPRLSRRITCASLLPLFTGLLPEDIAHAVIRKHVLNNEEFWLDYVFPFNARNEMDKERVYMENSMLWRGHCIWTNMNWMIAEGLREYGYHREAKELTRRTALMIRAQGFREFYDYRTGAGEGAPGFTWPALVLDMIKSDYNF